MSDLCKRVGALVKIERKKERKKESGLRNRVGALIKIYE
jgi:hypothetical protein